MPGVPKGVPDTPVSGRVLDTLELGARRAQRQRGRERVEVVPYKKPELVLAKLTHVGKSAEALCSPRPGTCPGGIYGKELLPQWVVLGMGKIAMPVQMADVVRVR